MTGQVVTARLRLEPITVEHAQDLWTIHNDDEVARWYGDWKPTPQEALEWATFMSSYSWQAFGVHKWMAYDRVNGDLIGRRGPSPTPADDDWRRINGLLPDEAWARETRRGPRGEVVHANWVEIGWALRPQFWGHGYATEIGRASGSYAFDVLGMRAVVACTDHDNHRSRAVIQRLGMHEAGQLDDLRGGPALAVYTLLPERRG